MPADYIELHAHTAFSFLDGASLPEELVTRASELGYTAMAVTDHDGLYGSMEFAQSAQDMGITPITGAEVTLLDDSHLTLLATSPQGYSNLSRLLTEAHRLPPGLPRKTPPAYLNPDGDGLDLSLRGVGKPHHLHRLEDREARLDPTLLGEFGEGVLLLTGCRQGALAQAIDHDDLAGANRLLHQYQEWLGPDQVVVELQNNFVHGDRKRIATMVDLANRHDLRYAATGNVHYHLQERHRLQDVLVAIKNRTTLDNSHRFRRPNAEFALRSPAEMERIFADFPQALTTTRAIAERCQEFNLARDLAYVFPDYPTPPDQTPEDLLRQVCVEAMQVRYPDNQPAAWQRLDEELAVISKHRLGWVFPPLSRSAVARPRGSR